MEILIALIVIVAVGAIIYTNREAKSLDVNDDGKVDVQDAKAAIKKTVDAVRNAGDVNKDGKVNVKDVKVAAKQVKAAVKAKTAKRTTAKTTKKTK
jgi:hypothetical protein